MQQTLFESAKLFARDVLRFSHDWQVRWPDPARTQALAEISEALLVPLAGLEHQFSRAEGPAQPQVAGFLGQLLGTPGAPGPLTRLHALVGDDPAKLSLDEQRLLSETDTLFIQLNGLRAQWQEYLSLATTLERASAEQRAEPGLPPLPPNPNLRSAIGAVAARRAAFASQDTEANEFSLPRAAPSAASPNPAPPAWQDDGLRSGLSGMLKALLPFILALLVIAFLAYTVVSRLPTSAGQNAPGTAGTAATLPTPGATPTAPTAEPPASPQPSPTTTPQPTLTPPAGTVQMSVNPPALLLPCPGTGAATLQVANIGTTPFDWQAAASGASGGDAGILLDGAISEQGHLNPGALTQISVTAQTATAQGTITVTAVGAPGPVRVSYRVNC